MKHVYFYSGIILIFSSFFADGHGETRLLILGLYAFIMWKLYDIEEKIN